MASGGPPKWLATTKSQLPESSNEGHTNGTHSNGMTASAGLGVSPAEPAIAEANGKEGQASASILRGPETGQVGPGHADQPVGVGSGANSAKAVGGPAIGNSGHTFDGGIHTLRGSDKTHLSLDSALEQKLQEWVDAIKLHRHGRLKHGAELAKSVLQIMALVVVVGFVVAAGVNVAHDCRHPRVSIDEIALPKALEERGYTSQTVAERLRASVSQAVGQNSAKDSTSPSSSNSGNSSPQRVNGTYVASRGKETIATGTEMDRMPDMVFPEIGMSFRGVVGIVDGLFHAEPRHISGEITEAQNNTRVEVVMYVQGESQLQVDRVPDADPDKAIDIASQDALFLVDPLVGATDALNHDEYDRAIREFPAALTENSKSSENVHGKFALAYLERGETRLTKVLQQDKRQSNAKDFDPAIEDFNAAIEQDSNLSPAYSDRGAAEEKQKHFVAALADYNQALTLSPRSSSARLNRGFMYLASGQCQQAASDLETVATTSISARADGYNGWAWVLATCPKLRDRARALSLAKKACSLITSDSSCQDPLPAFEDSLPAVQDTLAAAYAETGDFDNAVRYEQMAFDQKKADPEFSERLADYKSRKAYRVPITIHPLLPLPDAALTR